MSARTGAAGCGSLPIHVPKRILLPAILAALLAPALLWAQSLQGLTQWEEGRSMRATSTSWKEDMYDRGNNHDNIGNVAPGATHVLADLEGPGVITHIWMTFVREPHKWAPDGAANPQEMLLRMFWDGEEEPAVETPVGDFFASCFGKRMEVISLPVVVEDGDSYNCFWQMPFRKSARIEIVNQSKKPVRLLYYNVDWVKKKKLPSDTMYFNARYRQEYPARNGQDYLVLDAEGKGYYVGTVYAVRTRSPGWWGEGDEKIYIDGEEKPSIRGTGSEDYFLSAWGLKINSTPYFGVPYLNQHDRIVGQMTCSYRWHIVDPIVFAKSLRVTFETFGWISEDENKEHKSHSWNEREDDFSSVAFWYQTGRPKKFTETPPAEERILPSLERVIVSTKNMHCREVWPECSFEIEEKEPLRLVLEMMRSKDHGIFQTYLDGVEVGKPMDLYSAESGPFEFHIMDFWPDPGTYTLRFEHVGRNPLASNENIALKSIRLRERRPRVREFGYDKDKDWKKEQVLYD